MDQPRQPGGLPVGGQFAAKTHAEASSVALADALPRPSDIDDALYREVGKILSNGDGVTTENVIDFPDSVRIQNGDGLVQIKNPDTNEIILQTPTAQTSIIRLSNEEPRQNVVAPEPFAPPNPVDAPPDEAGA